MFTTDRYKKYHRLKYLLRNLGNLKPHLNKFVGDYFFGWNEPIEDSAKVFDNSDLVEDARLEIIEVVDKIKAKKFTYSSDTELNNLIEVHTVALLELLKIQEELASKEIVKAFNNI